ncbi:MFS transporter [Providencia sp. PROV188]|uniref:MFS transporter n=1 Tax=Providencia TaxID=586 RepID=UPI0003E1E8D6|nr:MULTISPECIES: MFS transporter [Providencia]ETS98285.1 drug resistance MFS transporter, drug:H+ antiporter-2 family [Providencia alcalifaciens PAL-3]EUC97821.1 drug resistance MFS transporter, drug:H+ antiporter-2 family [Providencia alcalifaciens PAL-1]MTB46402.1 MFS transporter [Providencia sp. wls1950]MTC23048.1 MFS transporter [Providencia sp. wls1938]MTC42040.1 MFS transporter [Providencia sp. wls1921]
MSYRYQIATVFLLGFFIDCINIFMSAIALPDIASAFSASQSMVSWVANAYILGLVLIMPVSLWLAGRLGVRKLLAYSMLLFSLSVGLCGFSDSIYSLIFWRFIQGIAGGLLIPVGQALVFALFPNQERQKISTMIMTVALIAPAFSPAIGGMIIDSLSWRWVFFANLPFSLLAALLAWCWVKSSEKQVREKPDIIGLLLVSFSLLSLLMSFSFYNDYQSLALALLSFALSAALLIVYLQYAKKCRAPILNLQLLKNYNLRNGFIVYYAVPGIFTGVNLLNIFNLQNNIGFNAQQTGMFMLVYAAGALISMVTGGYFYHRLGKRSLFIAGIVVHSIGILTLFWVDNQSQLMLLIMAYLLMGTGGGISANTAQISALIDFKDKDLLQGSVLWNINRQVAFSVGTVVLISLFNLVSFSSELVRYQYTFFIAAILGLLSLISVIKGK